MSDEQPSTAIARRATIPKEIATVLRELAFSEDVVRAALNSTYRDCPAPEVARALVKCARHDLDPLGDQVAVFKPKGQEKWAVFVTLKGYEEIASRHPDFGAITFSEPEERGDEIWIAAYVHRKGFHIPSGPFWGHAPKRAKRSQQSGGGTYDVPWPYELAEARAARRGLRRAIGLNVPPDDYDEEPQPWRDDQRRHLFFIANTMQWDDDRRHVEASKVLGRKVESWTTLTEEEATRCQIEWDSLVEVVTPDVDPETGEIIENQAAAGAKVVPRADERAPAPQPSKENHIAKLREAMEQRLPGNIARARWFVTQLADRNKREDELTPDDIEQMIAELPKPSKG